MPRKPATEPEGDLPPFLLPDDTSSESAESPSEIVFATDYPPEPDGDNGSAIDAEIASDSLNLQPFGERHRKADPGKAKTGPPTTDEWLDFFSRIVIRFATEWYADQIFSSIDEDIVSDADAAKVLLTKDERDTIARPFAEYANKNPFMRKQGRQVVAFADSFESLVILIEWFARVNRIARKYKKASTAAMAERARYQNGNNGQGATGNGTTAGSPAVFGVFNPGSG